MIYFTTQFFYIIAIVIFLSIVGIHLSKKNNTCVFFFIVQSLAVSLLLFIPAIEHGNILLILAALFTLAIKVVATPFFFFRLIKRNELTFSASNYLSLPMTLLTLALLLGFAYSNVFSPLTLLGGENANTIPLAIAVILVSIFLAINRRGALSQIISILSLENGIVALIAFLGVEQIPSLDISVTFDLAVWVVIATLFLSMIYKNFGTLDVNSMKNLTEE